MFSLNRCESEERQVRLYAVNKRATSSRTSLFSSRTSRSKRSTGSASTITQESYSKSQRRAKRHRDHAAKHRRSKVISSSMQAEKRARRIRQNSASDVDVFSYLVKDIADPCSASTSWEAERSRISKRSSVHEDPDETETKSVKSRLSDSAISMNDSGYDSTSPSTYVKPRLCSLPENIGVEHHDELQQRHYEHHHGLVPMSANLPQGHIQSPYQFPNPCWPPAPSQQIPLLPDDRIGNRAIGSGPTPSGYHLLASSLTPKDAQDPGLPPLYRRFSSLSHRILLQLQDEIAEMEADLHRLDDADAHYRRGQPASRRSDWGSGRLDLLSKIHVKIEQYHAAILSMQKVKSATTSPHKRDITMYRDWLTQRKPLQDMEMRFLDDEADVMSLDPPGHTSTGRDAQPTPYDFHILSSLAGVWLITCVPSVLSRWTFLILLALFSIATQTQTPSETISKHEMQEAWTRLKTIAMPLIFWMTVTAIC